MHRFDRRRYGKQQMILLLFLFLLGIPLAGWAQSREGTGRPGDPYKGDIGLKSPLDDVFYLDGVTDGYLKLSGNKTVHVKGQNRFSNTNNSPIVIGSDYTSTFIGDKSGGSISGNAYKKDDSNFYPAITGNNAYGELNVINLQGALFVNAYSGHNKVPGIGAPSLNNGTYGHGNGGTIKIKDGAFLNMTVTNNAQTQLPYVTIENFGAVNPRQNSSSGTEVLEEYPKFTTTYPKCFIQYTESFITKNGAKQDWADMNIIYGGVSYTGKVRVSEKSNEAGLYHLPMYFSATKPDYLILNGIPASLEGEKGRVGAVTVGGSYLETSVLPSNPSANLVLKVNNYQFSGTITPGANISFDGNNKKLCTTAAGLNLNANGSYTLELKKMKSPSGSKLIIGKKVFLASASDQCTLEPGVAQNNSGTPIYYCTATLPTSDTVTSILYEGASIEHFTQDGTSLRMWLPAKTAKMLRIDMADGTIYTSIPSSETKHYKALTLSRAFDINVSSVTMATGSSVNTITYNSKTYTVGSNESVTVLGNTTKTNRIIINGGYTGKIRFESLSVNAAVLPVQVTGNNTFADITLAGSNVLNATGSNSAIEVSANSRMKLTGEGNATLTASAAGESQNDIDNLGTLTLGGLLTLTASNSKFPPNAAIADDATGTVKVKLGSTFYYRIRLPELAGVATNVKYADTDQDIPVNLYHEENTTTWFWMKASGNRGMVFTGSKPKNGNMYFLSAQTFSVHNGTLSVSPVAAFIKQSDNTNKYYPSLSGAFTAATSGQTITQASDQTLSNTTVALAKLATGESVIFDPGSFVLTATGTSTLSAGKGILRLGTASTTGSFSGTFVIDGCVYTGLSHTLLGNFQRQGGQTVYRVWIKELPSGMSDRLTYRIGAGMEYEASRETSQPDNKACIWLPVGIQEATVADILPTVNEPVATVQLTVLTNHDNNTVAASPLPDIAYGDVVVTPGTTKSTVTYGSAPYQVQTELGTASGKRLSVYGNATADNGKSNQVKIESGGSGTAYLSLRGVNIQPSSNKAAMLVNAAANVELYGDNILKGGSSSSGTSPAIKVGANTTFALCNEQEKGLGRLYAYGGVFGLDDKAAIISETNSSVKIEGGTIMARRGDESKGSFYDIEGPLIIKAGSVDALSKDRPKNSQNIEVYCISVTTGLNPGEPYVCTYSGCDPTTFTVLPDAAGKIYCWQAEQLVSAEKTKVTLTHPVSYEKTEIEVVQVEKHDNNVAPIVIRLIDLKTGEKVAFGNLQDAFDAMKPGTEDEQSSYELQLLTRINNLRTRQAVPANTDASLDLGSFEISAQNGSEVAFDASANGAYLQIGGKGNIKNTFKIAGDIFITGVVPLTDAVVELNGKAVFRTLVKDLPVSAGNTYTYSYGQQLNVPFNIHDRLACLWLPDYGRSEELRFSVSGTGGTSTEYTAGNITTVTQRTEAIPANPVGVVARLTCNSGAVNQAFNTLQEAFSAAGKVFEDKGYQDITVHLLTGVSVSGTLKATGCFTLNLDGKNITSASGGGLQVGANTRMVITDATAGTKGSLQVDINLVGDAQLFIPGAIHLTGDVCKDGNKDIFYWRTLLNMNYLPVTVEKVGYDGLDYPVIGREVCLWLQASDDPAKQYSFIIDSKTETVDGYQISAGKHDNDMTIGGSNNVARIGTQEHATLKSAFDAAQDGQIVELLKTTSLDADYSVISKSITLELGKYELTGEHSLAIGSGASLIVKSQSGSGKIECPLQINGGNLYIGQDLPGDAIGSVSDNVNPRYRLLVTNLPANVPSGIHNFIFAEIGNDGQPVVSAQQSGTFMVRESIGCVWVENQIARRLTFSVGSASYVTENVTVNQNHYNVETYGVSDVAQIRNGKKYRDLPSAFADAAGKTIILLKNAALKQNIDVNGTVILETGSYTITGQEVGSKKATINIPDGANLQITGKGSISTDFKIKEVSSTTYSNANLQVDRTVTMTGVVNLDAQALYRVNVEGLPFAVKANYEYNGQKGEVLSSSSGSLCLWMDANSSSPSNFFVETEGTTYMATTVLVVGIHANPVTVTQVIAVAAIDDKTYDTLSAAFGDLSDGKIVNLRKSQTGLAGMYQLPGTLTGSATFDLGGNTLMAANASFDANNGRLVMANGILGGTVTLTKNVYAEGSVVMNNAQVSLDGKTVWRTFLTLPDGTTTFTLKLGDGAKVISNNIREVGGHPQACLWLPSSNVANMLTVTAGDVEYALNNVIIASTHGNELDLTGGNDPVAKVGDKSFASLASALAAATEGGTVRLLKDVSLSSVQDIQKSLTLDLGGFSYTSGNSGFSVVAGKELTIARGSLLGTIRLNGEGSVKAGSDVKVAGIVLNKDNKECYRTLMKVGPDAVAVMQCHWLESAALTYDLLIPQGSDTYEATVPADLDNHNTELTAYKRVVLGAGSHSWQPAYANTNLVLAGDAELSFENVTGTTILHRLTIRDGALVKTSATAGMVIAEEGIRYVRSFVDANQWESVALPFTTTRITTEESGQTVLLTPATGTGTAGNFWLKTMSAEGKLQNVSTTEMTANVSYLMAVPTMWSAREITFVSGPNQLLRRDKVLAVKPASGFASYANGTFDRLEVKEACYLLNVSGDAFELEQPLPVAVTVEPFRGYLLADVNTTTVLPTLRIGTATDVVIPSLPENLRIYTRRGCVVVEAQEEEDVFIYRFDGSLVRALRVGVGQTEILLAGGFYIVNRTKVIVKY